MTGRESRREGKDGGRDGRETPAGPYTMISARQGYAQKHATGC